MATSGQQKQQVITKIRAITKVVNEPSTNPLDSFIDNTIGPVLDDGLKNFDKQPPKKLTDLQSKNSKKKESKTDVFGDLIDIADAFLSGANKKIQLESPLESKSRLKQTVEDYQKRGTDVNGKAKAKQAHKEKMAQYGMLSMYLISGGIVIASFAMMGVQLYSMAEDKKEFEAAQARVLKIRREQEYMRDLEIKKQTDNALGIKN